MEKSAVFNLISQFQNGTIKRVKCIRKYKFSNVILIREKFEHLNINT